MLNLDHLYQLARFQNSPLAIDGAHVARMTTVDLGMLARAGSMRGASRAPARTSRDRTGRVTIKLHGIAEGGSPGLYSMLGMGFATTSIERELALAVMDDSCNEIVMSYNTPGGSVEGIPELAAAIQAAARSKVVTAMIEYQACSAGYWLASQCDRIICSPSAEVGSVGVYSAHQDVSGAMAKAGVRNTYVSAGKYKTEGRPDAPLSTDAAAWMQKSVGKVYDQFVAAVARGRNVTRAEVLKNYGQGRSMNAAAAKKSGLVDYVAASVDAAPTSAALAQKQVALLVRRM